jgi:hypothetical protein
MFVDDFILKTLLQILTATFSPFLNLHLGDFLKSRLPGFLQQNKLDFDTILKDLDLFYSAMMTKDPDSFVASKAAADFTSSNCVNATAESKIECNAGFVLDQSKVLCYKDLKLKAQHENGVSLCNGMDAGLINIFANNQILDFAKLFDLGKVHLRLCIFPIPEN